VLDVLCRQKPCNHPLLCPTSTHQFRLIVENHELFFTSEKASRVWLEKQATYEKKIQAMHEASA